MKKGRIIKLIGGLYTVIDAEENRYLLKPLGIFRYQNEKPKVGDFVTFDADSIVEIDQRQNELVRPSIANVDQVLVVQSAKEPDFSFTLLDRFLVLIEHSGIKPVIIVTKTDLLSDQENRELREKLDYYTNDYDVIFFSAVSKENLAKIIQITSDKVNVLAGQTGTGKSSLLNTIDERLDLATDEISKALGRGKHTTRHVELIRFHHGWIADTPGFSRLEFQDIPLENLPLLYPDFLRLADRCKFNGCSHVHEPDCAVEEACKQKLIPAERYENYLRFHEEIRLQKPKY